MREKRLDAIRDIISHEIIETQDDLARALGRRHFRVTQATVSRDIKELMLIKVPTGDGRYRYAVPHERRYSFTKERMERIFHDAVIGCDCSENILVIKTMPGSAGTVASVIDSCNWPEIIGTVAGDDNILAVIKPKAAAAEIRDRLHEFLK